MKVTMILLFVGCLVGITKGYSQSITLSLKNASLETAFGEIKKQSGYNFIYTHELLQHAINITLEIKDGSLEQVLAACFKDQPLTYTIAKRFIIIKPKTPPAPVFQAVMASFHPNDPVDIRGEVTDEDGTPMPGVSVYLKGNGAVGVTTDTTGRYRLSLLDTEGTLIFSFIGYTRQEVPVKQCGFRKVKLAEEQTPLNQVVVIGYGTQKKIDLSGAVSTMYYGNTLENRPITHLSQAIEGAAPGVHVSQASGQPGHDGSTIRIRGVGTLNDADPLVLVDGIVSSFVNLNPNDVAEISILKDAASAAIYGSRAANGVILVTTKKGKKGKTVINYNVYKGTQHATHLFRTVSNYARYMTLMNQIQRADNPDAADLFKPATIAAWQNATDRVLYPNTDWMKVIFGQGTISKHNLSISGGDDRSTFYLSGAFTDNIGVMSATHGKDYSFRLNMDHKVTRELKIGTGLSFFDKQIDQPGDVGRLIYYSANATPGITPFMMVNGMKVYGGRNTPDESVEVSNPLQYTDTWFNPVRQRYAFSRLYVEWEIIKGLKFQTTGALNYSNIQSKQYILNGPVTNKWDFQTMTIDQNNAAMPSTLMQENDNTLGLTLYSILTYKKTFAAHHHINILGGMSNEWNGSDALTGSATGFRGNTTWELSAGTGQPRVSGNSSSYSLRSFFGRLNYNYKEKYLVEANLRDDGSSRFAFGRRWGIFPSFSGAWRLSEETFFKVAGLSAVSNVKLRASWGKSGNQNIGLYQFMDLYGVGQNYIFGNTLSSGIAPTALSNPDISWETTTSANIGMELSFFNNHFELGFDAFNNTTNNILVQLPLSSEYSGLTAPYQNAGVLRNRGWELEGVYSNKVNGLRYSIKGNLTHVSNKVLKFQGNPNVFQSTGNNSIIKQGQSINALYGYQAAGIFQSQQDINNWAKQKPVGSNTPGDLKYKDQNGDGIVDARDRVIIGGTIPRYYVGFGGDLGYKDISLHFLLQGISGVQRYYNNLWYTSGVRYRRAINAVFADAWTPANTNTTVPRLTSDANTDNTVPSSYYVQDGSYLRLKNVQLSYTLPEKWIKRSVITNLQVYVNAQNLLTCTKFNGLDPETATPTNDQVEYPNVRIITFGLNVSF